MPQNGEDIAKNLGESFNKVISAPVNAVSNAVDKAKSFLGVPSLAPSKPAASSQDTSWHDDMVKKASQSLIDNPNPKPKTPAKATPKAAKNIPSYEKGTDRVPKTGPAILHKDEAVLPKDEAQKHREAKTMAKSTYDVADELGGKKESKPKKEIKHMHIKKASNGGHIIRHEHTHPDHHPDEEHTTKTDDELASHVLQNMGTQNPGEAEADAGQSGIPGAAQAPAAPAAGAPQAAPPQAGM